MAGHSKWANTRFRKAVQDQKRGKLFTKLIREITIAVKQGGPDLNANFRLRSAIDQALSFNLTRDAIDRAIQRSLGNQDKDLMEVTYEGYAPYGVAVIVECLTDNHIRTVSNVRHFFSKHGGNLGIDGSVSYLFDKQGKIFLEPKVAMSADQINQLMELAINAGAIDFELKNEQILITTLVKDLTLVKTAIAEVSPVAHTEITLIAQNYIKLSGENAVKILEFLDNLEDLDDVQAVYSNADFSAIQNESKEDF